MALSVKGGQITSPTSTGNQAITGIGFQPKLLILYSTLLTDANGGCSPTYGVGTSSSARWSLSQYGRFAVVRIAANLLDTTKIFRWCYATAVAGLTLIAADLVSLDADGFTLNWSTVDASGYPVNYLCLGGSDLSVKVGTVDSNTVTGNQAVTGVGFLPKALLAGVNGLASADGTVGTVRGNLSVGAGISSSAYNSVASRVEGGASSSATDTTGLLATNEILSWLFTTKYFSANLVSLDADGFTLNIDTTTGGEVFRIGYVALGGAAQFKVGTFAQPGSTGNQAITGVGFQPSVELLWSGGRVSSNTISDHARFMLGHSVSSSDRGVMFAAQKDNVSAGAESRAILATKSITLRADDAVTVLADADFVSQDADGFTNNWTTADATARILGYLAIGAAAASFDPATIAGALTQGFMRNPPVEVVEYH